MKRTYQLTSILLFLVCFQSFGQKSVKNNHLSSSAGEPKFVAQFGTDENYKAKEIEKEVLLAQIGISCHSMMSGTTSEYYAPCSVSSYNLLLISENKVIYSAIEKAGVFSNETKEQFKKLTHGDLIVVFNLMIELSSGKLMNLPSYAYQIK